ncbi:hypothetical protein [Aquimarina mytili]|uniref:Lipocalin-like domain-containing protein n=1 Tax=Aquimarina mytili TaxID=874423 RepID=A0A936ZW36_9FLAO|nr:hypothetical protein [Aquimarina mytili]MBL0685372.1 hypothetical protein [Aquimarina mytili]
MKKVNLLFASLFLATLFFTSCSSDDDAPTPNLGGETDNEITVADLDTGILIDGKGTEVNPIQGTPPSPTGTLNFGVGENNRIGILNDGFNIKFSSTDAIEGAYVQFRDANGNASENYYNIPKAAFDTDGGNRSANVNSSNKKARISAKMVEENTFEIDVDFSESLEPGEFCYAICVYDAQGNISVIEEVCVEINAWGGNDALVGEWIFDRYEPSEDNESTTIICDNQQELPNVLYRLLIKDNWTFMLNQDGTYVETFDREQRDLDFQTTRLNCEATYYSEATTTNDKYYGNWAFNSEKKTFTAVDYKYENLINSTVENFEEGDIYYEGVQIEVTSNELKITETYEDASGATQLETAIFKRK